LISLELQINTIILPSLNVKGDLKVNGDSYFSDANNKTYAFIDTDKKFMGINTSEVLNEYNTSISNIKYSTLNMSQQNMVVTSDLYPNLVADRNTNVEQTTDKEGNIIPNLPYFVPLAPVTLRRTSDLYSFDEMYSNSQKYTTPNLPGAVTLSGISTKEEPINTNYYTGCATAYEIKDKTGFTNILGRTFMGIDKIVNGVTKAGFGIQVNDIDNESSYRNILYVNNDSQLSVNSIKLGGHLLEVDPEGNLLFDGKKVNLSQ
jgi:hypothetical protein